MQYRLSAPWRSAISRITLPSVYAADLLHLQQLMQSIYLAESSCFLDCIKEAASSYFIF